MAKKQSRVQARVVGQPTVYEAIKTGMATMVGAVRPTYGPLRPTVLLTRIDAAQAPEQLDDGGLIARRIYAVPDRDEDVGAMLVRHLMWRMRDRYGDGTVTAALMMQAVYEGALKAVLNGEGADALRNVLVEGAGKLMRAVEAQAQPVRGEEDLRKLAFCISGDALLSQTLAQAVMRAGAYGKITVHQGRGQTNRMEVYEGNVWKGMFFSRAMIQDIHKRYAEIEDCAVLVSNLQIVDPYALAELLVRVRESGVKRLVLIARAISEQCLAVLESARQDRDVFDILAIRIWETTERWELEDLAAVTGGKPFVRESGVSLAAVQPGDLGSAKKVWIEAERYGILSGGGDEQKLRAQVEALVARMERELDKNLQRRLNERIASLQGRVLNLYIGGITRTDIETRSGQAERLVKTLQQALLSGFIPGGGVAYLRAFEAAGLPQTTPLERWCNSILKTAMETPLRTLLKNAGSESGWIVEQIYRQSGNFGYDVVNQSHVDLHEAGIIDSARVGMAVVYAAVSAAAQAISVDTIIHPRKRKESYTTG